MNLSVFGSGCGWHVLHGFVDPRDDPRTTTGLVDLRVDPVAIADLWFEGRADPRVDPIADPRTTTGLIDPRVDPIADLWPDQGPVADRPFGAWLAARLEARPEALHGKHCWRGAREAARDETLRGGSARGVAARGIIPAAPGRRGPRGSRRSERVGLKQP
jgi:hypothetical protein